MPQEADDDNTGQGTARPTTRSISARTRRSTSGGRLASNQDFSSGRSSSRTMSSSVGPPLCTRMVRSARVRTRPSTEDAAAAAASGATSVDASGATDRGATVRVGAGATGSASCAGSGTIIAGSRTSTLPPADSSGGCDAGGLSPAAGASSSLRIRRIEARISSIDGSPPAALPGGVPAAGPGGVCDPLIVLVFSTARLVGREIAQTNPFVLHRIVVGGLVIQWHRQVQVVRGQPSDRPGDLIRIGDDLCQILHQLDA